MGHINTNHKNKENKKIPFNKCEIVCAKKGSLDSHTKSAHKNKENKKYPCHHCDKICKSVNSLGDHVKSEHVLDIFKCPKCNMRFATLKVLNLHVEENHA